MKNMENNSLSVKGPTRRNTHYSCSLCFYKSDRKNNMKRHYLSMHLHSSKFLECCGTQFFSKAALRLHTKNLHKEGYVCRLCARSFCRRALLKRHMSVHNGLKEFSCELCIYASSHKSNLERHQTRVHGIPQKKHRKRKPVYENKKTSSPTSLNLSSRKEASESKKNSGLSDYQSTSYTPKLPHFTFAEQNLTTESINRLETDRSCDFSPENKILRLSFFPYKCFECKNVFKKHSEYLIHCYQKHPPRDDLEMTLIHKAQDKPLNLVIHPQRHQL